MPSNAIAAYGTLLKRAPSVTGTSGNVFTTLGEVKNIDGPSTEVSTIDVTTHSSATCGNYREFIPSLIDPGTIDVELNWVPSDTTHQNLNTDMTSRTKRGFQIITPASSTGSSANIQFDAYVVGFPKGFPTDDVISASISLKITGAITISVGP